MNAETSMGSQDLAVNDKPQYDQIAAALAKAQGEMRSALKDSSNPHFRSRYANLASTWDACRDALSRNGLAVVQAPAYMQGGVVVSTILMHSSGQSVRSDLAIPVAKADAQSIGSAITYARRYALAAMVGIAPDDDDDDGEGAVGRTAQPRPANVPISAEHRTAIAELIRSTKTNEHEFVQWLGADSLDTMTADQYERAKRGLEAKAAKMQKEAA